VIDLLCYAGVGNQTSLVLASSLGLDWQLKIQGSMVMRVMKMVSLQACLIHNFV
jgi:hypothetical protein